MRIAKPLLLVLTPIGVVVGLIHGYRVAGGLVVLMAGMLMIVGVAAFDRRDGHPPGAAGREAARGRRPDHQSPLPDRQLPASGLRSNAVAYPGVMSAG